MDHIEFSQLTLQAGLIERDPGALSGDLLGAELDPSVGVLGDRRSRGNPTPSPAGKGFWGKMRPAP